MTSFAPLFECGRLEASKSLKFRVEPGTVVITTYRRHGYSATALFLGKRQSESKAGFRASLIQGGRKLTFDSLGGAKISFSPALHAKAVSGTMVLLIGNQGTTYREPWRHVLETTAPCIGNHRATHREPWRYVSGTMAPRIGNHGATYREPWR